MLNSSGTCFNTKLCQLLKTHPSSDPCTFRDYQMFVTPEFSPSLLVYKWTQWNNCGFKTEN